MKKEKNKSNYSSPFKGRLGGVSKTICLLFLVFGLLSCGTSPETRFYTLSAEPANIKSIDSRKILIGVDSVTVAGYVERPQIVTTKEDTEISMSEYNRWAEPLAYSMQRAVAQNLSKYFKNGMAKPLSSDRGSYDYIVRIELNKFDGRFGGTAQLDAWWTVLNKDNKVVAREHSALSAPLGHDYNDLVSRQNDLLAALSGQIARKISKF